MYLKFSGILFPYLKEVYAIGFFYPDTKSLATAIVVLAKEVLITEYYICIYVSWNNTIMKFQEPFWCLFHLGLALAFPTQATTELR